MNFITFVKIRAKNPRGTLRPMLYFMQHWQNLAARIFRVFLVESMLSVVDIAFTQMLPHYHAATVYFAQSVSSCNGASLYHYTMTQTGQSGNLSIRLYTRFLFPELLIIPLAYAHGIRFFVLQR